MELKLVVDEAIAFPEILEEELVQKVSIPVSWEAFFHVESRFGAKKPFGAPSITSFWKLKSRHASKWTGEAGSVWELNKTLDSSGDARFKAIRSPMNTYIGPVWDNECLRDAKQQLFLKAQEPPRT